MNTELVIIVILAILLLAAAAGLVVLYTRRATALVELTRSRSECEHLRAENEDHEARLSALIDECATHRAKVAELTARQEEAALAHEEARRKLEDTFKALSADALKSSNEQFLRLAKERFESGQKDAQAELEKRKQAIEHLVKPISETLDKIEKMRKEDYGSLGKQLELMSRDQQMLRSETAKLVNALRRPEVRGRWGEMQLRRVAELAGMIEHCDFVEQQTTNVDGRSFRPDMIVMLPSSRQIVIDAKTPLDAYLNSLEAASAEDRSRFLSDHVRQIEGRVNELAKKDYKSQFDHSPDFVVLFIPGESFLQAAVQQKPQLIEAALERDVVIATPSTLISLLRVIALGWKEEQLAENARRIAENGKELHKRLSTAFEHLGDLRSAIERTVRTFNKTVGSFERNVLPQAKRFDDLGASSSRSLPDDMPSLEVVPRDVPILENAGDPARTDRSEHGTS